MLPDPDPGMKYPSHMLVFGNDNNLYKSYLTYGCTYI